MVFTIMFEEISQLCDIPDYKKSATNWTDFQ